MYLILCMHLYTYWSSTGLDIEEFCTIFSGLLFLSFRNVGLNLTNFVVSNYAKGPTLRMQNTIPKQLKMKGLGYAKLQNFSLEGDGNASSLAEIAPVNTDGGALFVLESKGSQISSSPLAFFILRPSVLYILPVVFMKENGLDSVELSFNSMGLFVMSWSPLISYQLFCIQYQ